jgi:predicted amidohydrolase
MEELNIAFFQMDTIWQSPEENILKVENAIKNLPKETDILLLPETFPTGFSIHAPEVSWNKSIKYLTDLQNLANQNRIAIMGTVLFKEDGNIFNRLLFITPNNTIQHYDKKHLFSLAQEEKYIQAGSKSSYFTYKNWKIKPQICYDLRFPEGARINKHDPYDVLIYLANWPEKRIKAWEKLLLARAIENQTYCIGVNRVGKEPSGINYSGNSLAIDFFGEVITRAKDYCEEIKTISLKKEPLTRFRNKFSFIQDQL